jgi:hypothetical protein
MLRHAIKKLNEIRFPIKSIPWGILIVHTFAFGLLAMRSGFYQDDWHFIYTAYAYGAESMMTLMSQDGHPMSAWSYILGFQLLGFKPLFWQLFSFLLRVTATIIFWFCLNRIWPNNTRETFLTALIFDLYPIFTLQSQAIVYFEIWLSYIFLGASFYFSILAIQEPKKVIRFTTLAILFKIAHTFTSEYTWGLELIRPVLLWLSFPRTEEPRIKNKTVLIQSLIYTSIFLVSIIWRGLLFESSRNVDIFYSLLDNPLNTIQDLLANGLQDIAVIMVTSWYELVQPTLFDISMRSNVLILIGILFCALLTFFFLSRIPRNIEYVKQNWWISALPAGFVGLVFGLLPFYAAGFFIHNKLSPWNGRFALGSLLGAALILVAIIEWMISDNRKKNIIFSLIIALLIGWHVQVGNNFYWAWEKQLSFFQQLQTRAPFIDTGTIILSEDEFLVYMGDYPTSFGVNTLYAEEKNEDNSNEIPLWFYPLSSFHKKFDQYISGTEIKVRRALWEFNGDSRNSIVINFDPGRGQCLWIMRPEYINLKALPQTTRILSQISNVDRIKPDPVREDSFLLKYVDAHPEQDWCFYYEQADLAYQYEQWEQVIQFWEAAQEQDLRPDNGFEYLPFIEAYAHEGNWGKAKQMTRLSQKTLQGIDPLLCVIWNRMENDTPDSPDKANAFESVREDLQCNQE